MPVSMSGRSLRRSTLRAAFACRPFLRLPERVCRRVLERAVDDTLFANRELQEHRRIGARRLAIVRHREHAKRHPILAAGLISGALNTMASAWSMYS